MLVAEVLRECPLCRLAAGRDRVSRVWYEDGFCVVVTCRSCGVPMVVLKRHTAEANCREVSRLLRVVMRLFPGRRVDFRRRSIPDHYHLHVR